MVILYSTPTCPRCGVLKKKMDSAGVEYEVCDNTDLMIEKGITNVPVLEVDGELLDDFKKAVDWVNDRSK